jgi:hypothetical protein
MAEVMGLAIVSKRSDACYGSGDKWMVQSQTRLVDRGKTASAASSSSRASADGYSHSRMRFDRLASPGFEAAAAALRGF